MPILATLLRRRYLVLGFLGVLIPLLGLLVLQYQWMSRLERMSIIAHRVQLTSYVDAIGRDVRGFYREQAQALDLPASGTGWELRKMLEARWVEAPAQGARRLFVIDFSRNAYGNLYFFDREEQRLFSPQASDESLAIILMSNPWQMAAYRGQAVQDRGLIVDERDPANRMLLRLFINEHGHLVAIVGMVLDVDWFAEELLPEIVEREMAAHFSEYVRARLTVAAGSPSGWDVIWSGRESAPREGEPAPGEVDEDRWEASAPLQFVFTDWSVSLETARMDPERWARAGFGFNMTLAALLAIVLLGGLSLALRAANRAVRLSEMKSDFVSNVSHELRTPVASIRTFGELLKLGHVRPEKVREYGEHIESESRRLSRLIDNILDFARIESGQKRYRLETGRLETLLEATIHTFEVRTRDRGFTYSLEVRGGPLPPLRMDVDAMGQVLHNLLDNAVKYSGESRKIEIDVGRTDRFATCTIRDHGVGIAPEEQRKVFDRFHRVGTGLVHDVKGSGLGLSIVQHVVAAHGGHLTVESEPGKGTAVTLHLPLPDGNVAPGVGEDPDVDPVTTG